MNDWINNRLGRLATHKVNNGSISLWKELKLDQRWRKMKYKYLISITTANQAVKPQ